MIIQEKRDGRIKARGCADKRKQEWISVKKRSKLSDCFI